MKNILGLLLKWFFERIKGLPWFPVLADSTVIKIAENTVQSKIDDWKDEALEKAQAPAVKETTHYLAGSKAQQSKSPLL